MEVTSQVLPEIEILIEEVIELGKLTKEVSVLLWSLLIVTYHLTSSKKKKNYLSEIDMNK